MVNSVISPAFSCLLFSPGSSSHAGLTMVFPLQYNGEQEMQRYEHHQCNEKGDQQPLADLFIAAVAIREVVRSSNGLLRFMLYGEKRSSERSGFRLYCIKFTVLAFISFIISLAVPLMSYFCRGLL